MCETGHVAETCHVGTYNGFGKGEGCVCKEDLCNDADDNTVSLLVLVVPFVIEKLF